MKKYFLLVLFVFSFGTCALASPATDLFREAAFYLEQYYHGYSVVNIKDAIAKYQVQLDVRCAARGEQCSFDDARPSVQGLVAAMGDRHTFYLSKDFYSQVYNQFRGLNNNPRPQAGLRLARMVAGRAPMIEDVIADGPAARAGAQAFDRIVSVNGLVVPPNDAMNWLQQKLNTDDTLRLSLERGPTEKSRRVLIRFKRAYIPDTNLPSLYESASQAGIFVLRIPSFIGSNTIGPRVHTLLHQAIAKNPRGIVVDVRGNGGGEETECLAAASAFLGDVELTDEARLYKQNIGMKSGRVTGNDPRDPSAFFIPDPALYTGPVAVLTSSSTASCGEMFAYLIQQAKRGPIVGEPTLGVLNTATEFFQLIDQSAIAITYIRAQNLDGTPLPERVLPDTNFTYNPQTIVETGRDAQLEKAVELLGLN